MTSKREYKKKLKRERRRQKKSARLNAAMPATVSAIAPTSPKSTSKRFKTLIVFDTNSLRSTEAGEVAYSFFAFGRPFQVAEGFITTNGLTDDIHIAIPTWAIEELKDQKNRQYKDDIAEFQKLAKRLSGLPHIPEIKLPEEEFDCLTYVGERASAYLAAKSIRLLEIKEEIANSVLQSMMKRVMLDENKKKPFAHSGKYKDAGFKDNMVWESLMHFEGVADYDKVIFVSKDGDYKNCDVEFNAKWKKYFEILKDENTVLATLTKDYGNYIEYRKVYDYAQKEYFDDYLKDLLKSASTVHVDGQDLNIEQFTIADHCVNVDMEQDADGDFSIPVINSKVVLVARNGESSISIELKTKTALSDLEYMEIEETTFEPEIH